MIVGIAPFSPLVMLGLPVALILLVVHPSAPIVRNVFRKR